MKLTVVQALPALEAGGVERGTLEIARALVEAGHRSIVIAAGGRLARQLRAEGSEHIDWPVGRKSPWTLHYVPRLRRLLRDEHVDILHARSRLPAWIAWLAWRGMPARQRPHFVTTMHGAHRVNRYSRIMTRGECVIAVSEFIRDHILTHYPDTDPGRIVVIPRGVDPAAFPHGYRPDAAWRAGWRRQCPQLADKPLITLPARLTRRKGHEDFIEITARLRAAGHDVHGLIVGGVDPHRRPYVRALEARIRSAGLAGDITLLGHRDDLREILASSRVVVALSTRPESFGRTALEALSLGVPVAGYDHGGTGEILRALYPAGRVPPGDINAATACLQRLIDDPPPVAPQSRYTLAAMQAATLELYLQCARRRPREGG